MSAQEAPKTSNYPDAQVTINLKETENGWKAWEDATSVVGRGSTAAAAVAAYAQAVDLE